MRAGQERPQIVPGWLTHPSHFLIIPNQKRIPVLGIED